MIKSQRLIRLMMVINAKKSFTVRELADEFGLSPRTITRDLQELSEVGFPIYTVQGRGGGYRLLQERMLPPIAFSENEAVAVFFACQSLQYFGSVPFDESAASAIHKFYHYLPIDAKEQIDRLRNRVVIWNPRRTMSADCLQTLLQAIMNNNVVTITYKSSDGETQRDIQPVGLFSSEGYWYCPAYCFLRRTYRLFRADRIGFASLNNAFPYRQDLSGRSVFDWITPDLTRFDFQYDLIVELREEGVRSLETNVWFGSHIEVHEDGGGTLRIRIPAQKIEFFVDLVWQLGGEAMIVEPAEAIDYIKQKIETVRQRYL
ncbi:helix-turn-helix transcriptional regulator [Paenibacillus sedimenti]|uniref:YafY family transcriptional regulator n=1 Tax=Paenibacillus sedimenti TaxID=2770274 RepID=A0A926KUQ5_9BACL|nr:YafY family protein [Paenibacillus sedimenti]MBD0382583.1 YafY family transcriptional regulator [Paenibacillus sedimenti]